MKAFSFHYLREIYIYKPYPPVSWTEIKLASTLIIKVEYLGYRNHSSTRPVLLKYTNQPFSTRLIESFHDL